MALVKCPECGKEISDTVHTCIHCGYKNKKSFPFFKKLLSKWYFVLIGIFIIFCCGFLILSSRTKIILKDSLNVQINSEISVFSLVKEVKNGKITSQDEIIDTSKLGKKKITITYLDKNNHEKLYHFDISIIDTESPVVEYKKEIITTVGNEIDLLKEVKVIDNSKEIITPTVEGVYDIQKEGEYRLKYIAMDSSQNKVEEEFILKVISINLKTTGSYVWQEENEYGAIISITYKEDNTVDVESGYKHSEAIQYFGTYQIDGSELTITLTEMIEYGFYNSPRLKLKTPLIFKYKIMDVDTLQEIGDKERTYLYQTN